MNKSQELYIELLSEVTDIREFMKRTSQYPSFLQFLRINEACQRAMFSDGTKARQDFFTKVPDLEEECKRCWKFYLNPRNKSVKKYDIMYGKKFEYTFIQFLNKHGIRSEKADKKNAALPDNLVIDKDDEILAYYEVKYHNAPFVWRFKYTPGRECYEGSITLDYKKVEKQIKAIREITSLPVLYLHWVDFPCIKGIFYMTLEDTLKELKLGINYSRKEREGDFITSKSGKIKVGYSDKFYPSILKMKTLEELISEFSDLK